jgi:hypothetical protein
VASRVTMRGADGEVPITEQVRCSSCVVLQELCCSLYVLGARAALFIAHHRAGAPQELRCSLHAVCCNSCIVHCMLFVSRSACLCSAQQ